MHEIIEDVLKWHYATFPKETEKGQYFKVCSEIVEMWGAGTDEKEHLKEKADVCIALISLAFRYDSEMAQLMLCNMLYERRDEELLQAIKDKMEVNKKRTWKKVNGEYRH
jgi:hypothetical protein